MGKGDSSFGGPADADEGSLDPRDDDGDLIDNSPPPPDDEPVIIIEDRRHARERSWFLAVFLVLFTTTMAADLAGSAWLHAAAWAQMKPEVQEIRTFLFQVFTGIIGFYFGTRHRRH